jgi:hypothetical protein
MKAMRIAALPIILALTLALSACDVAPRGKTVVLPRPTPSAAATPAPPGKLAFELEKASRIAVRNFDQAGYFAADTQFIYGWLDNDRLAAIGVKPVNPAAEETLSPNARVIKEKLGYYLSADGLVGQILSVDWETGEATELHTVQDEVITSIGLSHDKTKLWSVSTDETGTNKLSVSDISLTHELLEVPDFTGNTPVWSSRDKYLGYLYISKSRPYLKLFDGSSVTANPFEGPYMGPETQYAIDDDTGYMLTTIKNYTYTLPLPEAKPGASDYQGQPSEVYVKDRPIPGVINKPTWVGSDLMLCISESASGRSLYVLNSASQDPPDEYKGVVNYALSDDLKYICLVRETSSGLADIYVGEWSGGIVGNEKLVFKGFTAEGALYFSPDDTKLYMEGRYGYADADATAMVLKFR